MKINIHAGHNPDGKVACGAIGFIKESTEARKLKEEIIRLFKQEMGVTVYDCTCDNGTSQSDVLNKIVTKCNQHTVDLDISLHFNAGAAAKTKDGKTTGTEILLYSSSSKVTEAAKRVLSNLCSYGFRNRGIQYRKDLKFLNSTKAPAMLIEVCFVDDPDDVAIYDCKKAAKAIVKGILATKEKQKLTKIMGKAKTTKKQMVDYLLQKNPEMEPYAKKLAKIYLEEGKIEGVRGDIAFAQACLETGNFTFLGSAVTFDQYNFCGMGVLQNGQKGNSFLSLRQGIQAHIQHLKAYADTTALVQSCVDPRFCYVKRGCAKYVEFLGIQENPEGLGWAAGQGYGQKILEILDRIKKESH